MSYSAVDNDHKVLHRTESVIMPQPPLVVRNSCCMLHGLVAGYTTIIRRRDEKDLPLQPCHEVAAPVPSIALRGTGTVSWSLGVRRQKPAVVAVSKCPLRCVLGTTPSACQQPPSGGRLPVGRPHGELRPGRGKPVQESGLNELGGGNEDRPGTAPRPTAERIQPLPHRDDGHRQEYGGEHRGPAGTFPSAHTLFFAPSVTPNLLSQPVLETS